jgi:hypothetical protein
MMIHDYSGSQGPIEQPRIQWFVGPDWDEQMRKVVLNDLYLPCPPVSLTLGLTATQIQKALAGIIERLAQRDNQARLDVQQYYANIDVQELAAVFGPNPPRRPRVLFLTTRFSTVLQYSTQDTAAGFREAGWETRVMIEPTRYHRILTIATRNALVEFKPDLIFQIDHHRCEHPGMFPPNVPFVCWIQDHLEHLMSPDVGPKLGMFDFSLTDSGQLYSRNYGYPQRQLIAVAKLTTAPPVLPAPTKRAEDIVFISNASASPDELREKLVGKLSAWSEREREFAGECVNRIAALHKSGQSLTTFLDICSFLKTELAAASIFLPQDRFFFLARELNHPVFAGSLRKRMGAASGARRLCAWTCRCRPRLSGTDPELRH